MTTRAAWLWAVALLFLSCQKYDEPGFAEGRLAFRELLTLRDQIAKEFNERVGDVSIADKGRMTVKLIDSPLSSRTPGEKQQHADAVTRFVLKNYKQPLSSVSIQFVSAGNTSRASASETYVGRSDAAP